MGCGDGSEQHHGRGSDGCADRFFRLYSDEQPEIRKLIADFKRFKDDVRIDAPLPSEYETDYSIFQLRQSGVTVEEIEQMDYIEVVRFFMLKQYDGYAQEKYHEARMKKKR